MHILDFPYFPLFARKNIVAMTYDSTLVIMICVLILHTPYKSSSVLQWHNEEGNFFSEYDQSNWLLYVGNYLQSSPSLLYVLWTSLPITCSDYFIFPILPNSKFSKYFTPMFIVSRCLSNIKQCPKRTFANFVLSLMFSLLVKVLLKRRLNQERDE